jgi:hypothetical protein
MSGPMALGCVATAWEGVTLEFQCGRMQLATTWNCCWLQGCLPVAISIRVHAGNIIRLPVMTRLTNDLRSHPVSGCVSWTSASEMVCKFNHVFGCTKIC